MVLEEDLDAVRTYSVGQVFDGRILASYHGVQRNTRDNRREMAYGGSDLPFVRGDLGELLKESLSPPVRRAVEQARDYHAAASAHYAGFFASRVNCDVAQGIGADGRERSGVLEQSWRVGGATPAELAALERMHERPDCRRVRASCFEVYGPCRIPPGATVFFEGCDSGLGPLAKYALIQDDIDTA